MIDKKLRDTIANIFPKIVFILVIISCVYIVLCCKNERTQFVSDNDVIQHETLVIDGFGEVKAPYYIEAKKNTKYIIRDIVPDNIGDDWYMMVYSNYSRQNIHVGDKAVGSYGMSKPMSATNLIGNIRVIAPLNKDMAGHQVTIAFTPYYDANLDYNAPIYGTREALINNVIKHNSGRIIMLIMLFTLYLLVSGLTLFIKFSNSPLNVKTVGYYAFLLLSIMGWIVCSSDIPQFFTNANVLVAFMSYIFLSLIGIAYNGFCEQTFEEGGKLFEILMLIGWILPFVNVVGFLMQATDPMILLPFTHMYFLISVISSTFVAVNNWRKQPENRILCMCIGILILTVIVGMVSFMLKPTTGRSGFFVAGGLLLFSLGLFGMIISKLVGVAESDQKVRAFRELAYEDVLTGLGNRSKFEKFFDDIDTMEIEGRTVTLFMFDLNFLKKVNDEFGHKAGDQMIIGLAKCIDKVFGKIGSCYRLGGDEFAAIDIGHADHVLNIIEDFKKAIEEYNKYNEHKISTAIGYSTRKFRHGDPDFYSRLFREADDLMYANKVRMHEEMGEEVRNVKKD